MTSLPLDVRRYEPASSTTSSPFFDELRTPASTDASSEMRTPESPARVPTRLFLPPEVAAQLTPPRLPPPPATEPPGHLRRALRPGDMVGDGAPDDDKRYRVVKEIARTHYGGVYIAEVYYSHGTLPTRQQVILKEFRTDADRLQGRGFDTARRDEILEEAATSEFDVSILIDHRLRRERGALVDAARPDKTLYFLLTTARFTTQPARGVTAYYLVSRYVPRSIDLHDFILDTLRPLWRDGAVGRYWVTALLLARQITLGLAALHAAGVVHRDIKPANVVVYWDRLQDIDRPAAYLIDFGHSCLFDDPLSPLTTDPVEIDLGVLECDAPYISTPGYLDPAIARVRRDIDAPALFALIKNADVYAAAQTIALMFDVASSKLNPRYEGQIARGTDSMPPGLLPLLGGMTAYVLGERLSAADAAQYLERILDHIDPDQMRPGSAATRGAPSSLPRIQYESLSETSTSSNR